jgi:hypothetical protein
MSKLKKKEKIREVRKHKKLKINRMMEVHEQGLM